VRGALAAAALLLLGSLARADITADSSFGYEGWAVPGAVTPVRVDLASSERTPIRVLVEITAARGMKKVRSGGVVHAVEVYLAPGAKKRLTIPVLPQPFASGEWTLTLTAERRTLLRHGTEFADGRTLTVDVGPGGSGAGVNYAETLPPILGVLGDPQRRCGWLCDEGRFTGPQAEGADGKARRAEAGFTNQVGVPEIHPPGGPGAALPQAVYIPPESAPDTWLCYEGFDAILWLDPDPESLKDASRLDALLEYAACGGRLVVAATPGGRLPPASPLARALPAEGSGHDDVPAEEVLAALGGTGKGAGRAPVPVARLARTAGRTVAALPDGRPLAVARSYGLGTVVVLAFDPRLLSGAGAGDQARLLGLLLGASAGTEGTVQEATPFYGTGIEPLLNHLRKRFLSTPPLGMLVLGLVLYVLAIGPVDYLLLKRKGKLRRTVVTFPLIVVGFTGLAYGASFLLFGGSSGQAQVAWLDFATAPGGNADVVRGIDVVGAYSPTGSSFSLAFPWPRAVLGSPWIGSGMAGSGADEGSLDGTVLYGGDGRPAGEFSLPLRSHRPVQARFSGEVPLSLDAAVRTAGDRRVLALRNGLGRQVRDLCILRSDAKGTRAFFPGDLAPGASTEVDLAAARWIPAVPDLRLTDPFSQGAGFFFRDPWRGRFARTGFGDQFVPRDASEEASAEARERMARAAQGVTLAGLFPSGSRGLSRGLGRQGLDLSRALREGRIVVAGWCDGDPLGALPPGRNMRSTVVVVRRVLPAEEGP
jgi:hypothetical protein